MTIITFPTTIAYGATGGPKYKTRVFEADSGFEQRNSVWSEARYTADVSTGIQSKEDITDLITFFRHVKGRTYPFRFKDWSDYEITNETIGNGDGTEVDFQIIKKYVLGVDVVTRTIRHPVASTLVVSVNGSQTTAFTLNDDTGIITFDTAPANGHDISVTCEFDVLCRFDTDHLAITLQAFELGGWDSINIVEVKEN
jgi:uncharacterized protein (TIGR02217 family)